MQTINFHLSTTSEILAIKDRVRHLINHWGEEGRYKEAVLKNVLQRFLPEKYSIATGFVVKQTEIRGNHVASSQIDLIVYDKDYPVLFRESDFVIVTPDAVRAIIEIKANIQNQNLEKIIKKSNSNGKFIFDAKVNQNEPFFNGIFAFEGFKRLQCEQIANKIISADSNFINYPDFPNYKVNHISFNKDWFFKNWGNQVSNSPNYLYKIENQSFPFFIGNLLDFLNSQSVIENSNLWFSLDNSIKVSHIF